MPASPTCDGSTLTGVGIQLAGQVFYHWLLLKTPTWEYRDARSATLTAAKRLFPGSCTVFDKVKAAWNAVSVPARPGEPTCTIRTPVLAFRPPTHNYGQVAVGQTASQTFTLTNSGGSASGALTITLSGPGAAEFTITGTTCRGALPPRQSCEVTVRFAATSRGPATASLTAAGNRPEAKAIAHLKAGRVR